MATAAHREILGQTLDNAQNQGFEPTHAILFVISVIGVVGGFIVLLAIDDGKSHEHKAQERDDGASGDAAGFKDVIVERVAHIGVTCHQPKANDNQQQADAHEDKIDLSQRIAHFTATLVLVLNFLFLSCHYCSCKLLVVR